MKSLHNEEDLDMDMSAMSDLIFLLLLFFILASTLAVTSSIDINLPKTAEAQTAKRPTLTLTVDAEGQYFLDDKAIELTEIEKKFAIAKTTSESHLVHLKADAATPVQAILHIQSLASKYKVPISILVKQETE
ncbi:ExbD/TolR family protein [Hugenholtzia roseola]|uniref:ExbD/TolR family protein n=1 Tax=Hugenholtzia roseola TaxID=1002 RepID=UPI00042588FC|nr:biopolymer transporter ExbD [Hugenholtzia roseola]